MWRYLLIATVLVLGAVAIFTPFRQARRSLEIASVNASPAGNASATDAPEDRPRRALGIEASWALSALPDCLRACAVRRGSEAEIRARLPARSERLAAGSVVTSGACRVIAGADDVRVERSDDRLRVPPPSALYALDGGIALVERRRNTAILRTYATRRGSGFGPCPLLR
jgi:hypothetical protein